MCVYTHLHAILTACNARHLARACQHPGQIPEPPRAYCSCLSSHCFPTSARYCIPFLFGMSLPAAIHTTEDPTCLWSQSKPWVKSSQGSHQKVPAIPARHFASQDLSLLPPFRSSSHAVQHAGTLNTHASLRLLFLAQITAALLWAWLDLLIL